MSENGNTQISKSTSKVYLRNTGRKDSATIWFVVGNLKLQGDREKKGVIVTTKLRLFRVVN